MLRTMSSLFGNRNSSSSATPPSQQQNPNSKPDAEAEAEEYNLIPALPDDVALNCLARVPLSHHPNLSKVSKPIRSLLTSPLLFNARSLHHSTEHLIYLVTTSSSSDSNWFSLSKNLNRLVPVPSPPASPKLALPAYAVVSHNIYLIGGAVGSISSPDVWVLDCRFNRWQPGPAMLVPRSRAAACVVDGKIYVMGGCQQGSPVWGEVLDPHVGRWEEVPCPLELQKERVRGTAVDGKVYVSVEGASLAYDPRNKVWESVGMDFLWKLGTVMRLCEMDGVLYSWDFCGRVLPGIRCTDVLQITHGGEWKILLELGIVAYPFMVDFGGKLLLVWKTSGKFLRKPSRHRNNIFCAAIEVNKNEDAKLRGQVCWLQKIRSLPSDMRSIIQCLIVNF